MISYKNYDAQASQDEMIVTDGLTDGPKPNLSDNNDIEKIKTTTTTITTTTTKT